MTVVAFTPARFTPDDLAVFGRIAEDKLRTGRWSGLSRETARTHDRLLVRLPGSGEPVFRFERDGRGRYALWFRDREGWHGIGSGETAEESLAIWLPRGLRRPVR